MIKNIDQVIQNLFEGFGPKQQEVLSCRFGLNTGKKITLQKVGDKLGVTRERVRQIQEVSLRKINDKVKSDAGALIEPAVAYLKSQGGIRRDDQFISEIKEKLLSNKDAKHVEPKIRFLLVAAQNPLFHEEDDDMNAFWYTDEDTKKNFFEFVNHNTQALKKKKEASANEVRASFAGLHGFSSPEFLLVSKKFAVNKFGDMGLSEWSHITPSTVRDKAYLVLKREGRPLHFEEIAKLITHYALDNKATHIATVHNELIKDGRFVLVGRGIYALSENGYQSGTVQEVVQRLLKKQGPLHSHQVVQLVNQQRILKTNTILLSLQNKRYFKRLDDGRYQVKQA